MHVTLSQDLAAPRPERYSNLVITEDIMAENSIPGSGVPGDLVAINTSEGAADGPGEVMEGLPHSREIGMRLHRSVDGKALLSIPWDERLVGDPDTGVLHGGVITALLDTASGSAVMSMPIKLRAAATLDLRIDYMRPATKGLTVYASAECYRMTRTIGFTRAVAY
ncbi:MAG: PaaI family thioesterase, partial [Pseudomonadota bacterium]